MSRNGLAFSHEYLPTAPPAERSERKALPSLQPRVHEPLTLSFRQASAIPAVNVLEGSPRADGLHGWESTRIAIKANGRIMLIQSADILVVEAQGNYVLLRQKAGSLMVREQISALADKLQAYGLIRIHRSVLVNAAHVEGVQSLSTGEYLLRMSEGMEYHVTRTYKSNLQLLAPTWIGA